MGTATLKYEDALGITQTQTYDVVNSFGLDKPWKWDLLPKKIYGIVDGSARTEYRGFKRIFKLELLVFETTEDFIRAFLQADTKSIAYAGMYAITEESHIIFESPRFEDEWYFGFQRTKKYIIELTENFIRTTWPVPIPIEDNMIGYIFSDIEVIGTLDSPETFTVNVGKLARTPAIPPISLSSYRPTILFDYRQAWMFQRTSDFRQAGDNISFDIGAAGQGELDLAGNPKKASFILLLEAI